MSKLLNHLPALCNFVKRVAMEAGDITMEHFIEGGSVAAETKGDGTPVTIADRAAETFIFAKLKEQFPDIPTVGEEAVSSGAIHDLSGHEYFWLVDPLDGTREFAKGSKDFTVNIGLIRNGVPVLGVIYAPAYGEGYSAYGPGTAMKWNIETEKEKAIQVRKPQKAGLTVIASKSRSGEELEKFLAEHKVEKVIHQGSSLKICAVASGKADIYPNAGLTCEWDTAAGHAILNAAGGDIVDRDTGEPLRYGGRNPQFYNPRFIARTNYIG